MAGKNLEANAKAQRQKKGRKEILMDAKRTFTFGFPFDSLAPFFSLCVLCVSRWVSK
ncbi:MAG: hypothetical protein ACT4PG_07365 [Panacagrimonas sp.]